MFDVFEFEFEIDAPREMFASYFQHLICLLCSAVRNLWVYGFQHPNVFGKTLIFVHFRLPSLTSGQVTHMFWLVYTSPT